MLVLLLLGMIAIRSQHRDLRAAASGIIGEAAFASGLKVIDLLEVVSLFEVNFLDSDLLFVRSLSGGVVDSSSDRGDKPAHHGVSLVLLLLLLFSKSIFVASTISFQRHHVHHAKHVLLAILLRAVKREFWLSLNEPDLSKGFNNVVEGLLVRHW
jgi:hypothetical protein